VLSNDIPVGWAQYTTPEGQPYFYHDEMVCMTRLDCLKICQLYLQAIITETWIEDPELFQPLNRFIEEINDFTRSKNLSFPDTHLVLHCSLDNEGQAWCGYYYVCHATRILFWLENRTIESEHLEVKGKLHSTHISKYDHLLDLILSSATILLEIFLETQYWYIQVQFLTLFSGLNFI